METLEQKLAKLEHRLADLDGLVVAFSGGVDSTLLLAVAARVLGDRVVAGTIRSPLNPAGEIELAERTARQLGVKHVVLGADPLEDDRVASNPPDRCYWCKLGVFGHLRKLAEAEGIANIAHGEHAGDRGDYRPGHRAAVELGILAPLAEAELDKDDVRELSRRLGLEGWQRPSMACLASRIPYGERLTDENLQQVSRAEESLRALGLTQVRVRHHGSVARIEMLPEDLSRLADSGWRQEVVDRVKQAGYLYVTADLGGFRSGSMNEPLLGKGRPQP